jgi:hypothetical protein
LTLNKGQPCHGHGAGTLSVLGRGAHTNRSLDHQIWGAGVPYEYDVFISYRRRGNIKGWVRNHLSPVLQNCLEDQMDDPAVFVDDQLEVGVYWPDQLEYVLSRSRYLLAVLAPPYFSSAWCMAEWASMRAREQLLGIPAPGVTLGLIYPVVFADGDSFPADARVRQSRFDLSRFGFPYPQFSATPAYLDFHDTVQSIAREIAGRLAQTPPWQDGWPVQRPEPFALPKAALPRLGG